MAPPDGRNQTKPFASLLQEMNRGRLHADLSDEVADVIGAVVEHGKKGTVTLKLDIRPRGDDAVEIGVSYTARPPQPPASPSIFFADTTGQVSRQRLNQPELPLTGINGGASDGATTTAAGEAAQA